MTPRTHPSLMVAGDNALRSRAARAPSTPKGEAGGRSTYPEEKAKYRKAAFLRRLLNERELAVAALTAVELRECREKDPARRRELEAESDRLGRWVREIDRTAKGMKCCRATHARGEDSSGHRAAALLYCRRPGCSCVAIDPETDLEGPGLAFRMRRALPRLEWAGVWVYVVATIPKSHRHLFRDKAAFTRLHRLGAKLAAELRPDAPGCLTRIHEFGDESRSWHPHVNVLIPLPEGARWKVPVGMLGDARRLVEEELGLAPGEGVIHYSYVPKSKRTHRLRYVLRDTLHPWRMEASREDLETMLVTLKGQHAIRYHGELSTRKWGRYSRRPEVRAGLERHGFERDERLEHADKGGCPCCGERMTWSRELGHPHQRAHERWLELLDRKGEGTGYFVDEATWRAMEAREDQRRRRAPAEGGPP